MRSKKQLVIGVSAIVIVLGVIGGLVFSALRSAPEPKPKKTKVEAVKKPKPKRNLALCPLDGREGSEEGSRPVAIMVENLSTIRPQAGIGSACIVVEGLAEGGITRFMLVYGRHGSDNIGPVRSARTHFAALAKGWDAIYAHVGGSIYALKAIQNWGIADWDQSSHPDAYTRVRWTGAPHNVFTATARLRAAASQYKDGGTLMNRGFKFEPEAPLEARPESQKVVIDFSTSEYRVEYRYDRQSNTYKRFNGGAEHKDANTKEQVAPTNIVIMRATTSDIAGGSGVLDINMEGSGEMTVVRNGQVIQGFWERPKHDAPLKLKDAQGQPVSLSPGQTWIEIVRPTTPVTIE